jgi:hypothetical protein
MQKFIVFLIIVFFFYNSNAQSWTYKGGDDAFDGKYKTCSIIGDGTEFPYTNPLFVINVFKGEISDPNIYLTKVPSGSCDNNRVLIKFDSDDKIYEPDVSISRNKEQWFLDFTEYKEVTESVKKKIKHYIVPDNHVVRLKDEPETTALVTKELTAKDTIDILDLAEGNPGIGDYYRCRYKGKFVYVNIAYLEGIDVNAVESDEEIDVPITKEVPTFKELQAFIKDLKTHSKMHTRLLSDCIKYDCSFSLSGSTAAINYVMNPK